MKKYIYLILALIVTSYVSAQTIDRSVQPKPGPAPKIVLETPYEFELKNGLKVLVVTNKKLPRVAYSLTIDKKPLAKGDKKGIASILGAMLGNGTSTIAKDTFNEEIDFLGARLNFRSNGASASGLSKYSERILELLADATINPLLTEDEFQKEKDKAIEGLKISAKSVEDVAARVGDALSFGKKHPYGEFTTEETLNNISLDNIRAHYEKTFNPNNAYLVIVGDVDLKTTKKQVKKYFKNWEKSANIDYSIPDVQNNVQYTQINFIDMPNAVQSNVKFMNNIDLKMNDPDYFAALIANKIFGGGFNGYLNMNLREKHGFTYGAYSSIYPSRYNGAQFSAGAKVRNQVTDSTVTEMLKEIKRIRTENVTAEDLRNAKAKYVGDFVLALEKPSTIARYALNTKLNKLPKDYYSSYLKKINAVTVDDVKRVANKYIKADNGRIVIVGKGSDVISALEKTGIPIKYFDKYASPIDKPQFSKAIPDGVSAQTVVDNYIKAIGGKTNADMVNAVNMAADVTIEGVPMKLSAVAKMMKPHSQSIEMSANGMVMMKQKFNGTSGYVEQQGMKKELTPQQIEEKKGEHAIFPELYYDTSKLSLENITAINGDDNYKLKVEKPQGKFAYRYYNTTTGLLTRVEETTNVNGQDITTTVEYSKYSPVNNVKFPYYQIIKAGPQTIIMNSTNITVNQNVSASDFN